MNQWTIVFEVMTAVVTGWVLVVRAPIVGGSVRSDGGAFFSVRHFSTPKKRLVLHGREPPYASVARTDLSVGLSLDTDL